MSAECKKLRGPNDTGPDCGCRGDACALGRDAAKRRRVHLFDAEQTCSFCGQPWSKHDPTLPDDPDGPMLLCPVDEQLAAYRKRPNAPGVQGAYERALEWLWTHRHDGEQYREWIRQRIIGLRFLRGES